MDGEITMRTEKDICTLCYDIQDACNFVPVCRELIIAIDDLKSIGIAHEAIPKHPAVIIMVDKINDMIGRPKMGSDRILNAFKYCREMKESKDTPIIEVP